MALVDAVQIYFQGEKLEALLFILPLGLMSVVFGLWLLTDNPNSFAKGVAIPFLLLGLLMTTVVRSWVTERLHKCQLLNSSCQQTPKPVCRQRPSA